MSMGMAEEMNDIMGDSGFGMEDEPSSIPISAPRSSVPKP